MSSALAYQPEPVTVGADPRSKVSNSILLAGACAVLLFGPLAFGAVQPWAIFVLEAASGLLLLAWVYRQWVNREIQLLRNPLFVPMLAFVLLAAMQWTLGITAYRHATYQLLLLYLSYFTLTFIVTQTLRRSSQLGWLSSAVCGYGAAIAVFALIQGLAPNGKLYWLVPLEQGGNIYGPYVNHNHYAGLMEMLTPFPLAIAASRLTHRNRRLMAAGSAALMAASIFLSGSRAGMIAFCVQVVVLGVLMKPHRQGWKQPVLMIGFIAVVIGFLVWVGGNDLTHRLASIQTETQEEIGGGVRVTIDRDSLRMWREHPIAGWGLGAFPVVYPAYRSFYTRFFVNEAHNDYLQMLVEMGTIGAILGAWLIWLTFRNARNKLDGWVESPNGTMTVAAVLGCIGILLHSALDFNLQIPANAALFYVLCAIAASPPLIESKRRRVRRQHSNLILEPQVDPKPEAG